MNESEKRSYYCVIPADVLDDERIPDGAKLLYGEITALCNCEGYCWASNEYLAKRRNHKSWTIINWINLLCDCGYLRRVLIYEEGKKNIKERRLYLRDAFCLECEKSNEGALKNQTRVIGKITVAPCENSNEGTLENHTDNNTVNNTINNTINKYTADFEEFWKLYPRKVGKAAAYKTYKARLKEGVTQDTILTALKNYNCKISYEHTAETYIMYPKTFLSKDRNFDDYLEYSPLQEKCEDKPISKLVFDGDDLPF